LTVALPTGGALLAVAYDARHNHLVSGGLTIVVPCTNPATTTIEVHMNEAPIVLSQNSAPCGTVTFIITNDGTVAHQFEIAQPDQPGVVAGLGPLLQPGQTATLTVDLAAKGRASYLCAVPEHLEDYGEGGSLLLR
jgi:hypothetical protein